MIAFAAKKGRGETEENRNNKVAPTTLDPKCRVIDGRRQ